MIALGIVNWVFYGTAKMALKLLAPVAALVVDRRNHPIWGIEDWHEDEVPYWEAANPFGNACHNFALRDAVPHSTYPNPHPDPTLEKLDGFQWRFRRSKSGNYWSLRITWGKPRRSKGKKELYIGWTINEQPVMRPTLQFRPW